MGPKLKQLLAAARAEAAPAPPAEFAADVLRAVQAFPPAVESASIWDPLDAWFPRVASAAIAVMLLCLAADWGLTQAGLPGLSDGMAQITSQFWFNPEEL
jgi:anti-sigma-K factor RskA